MGLLFYNHTLPLAGDLCGRESALTGVGLEGTRVFGEPLLELAKAFPPPIESSSAIRPHYSLRRHGIPVSPSPVFTGNGQGGPEGHVASRKRACSLDLSLAVFVDRLCGAPGHGHDS